VSKAELESGAHGPAQCWKSCHELGMEMSALVLIEHARAGCVCAVRGTQASSRAASAAAAAEVVIQEDEAAADNANRTAMHPYTPH
jgi:hypothetical protein